MCAAVAQSVSKDEQLKTVKVFPSEENGIECRFDRDFVGEITIFNPNDFKVAFKLKRTLPEFINISPGYGYVRSQESKLIKVNVGKVKEEAASHSDHRISVLVCQAPVAAPKCAKDIWRSSTPTITCKKRIPVKFTNKESSSSDAKSSVASTKVEEAEKDKESSTTTSSNPKEIKLSNEKGTTNKMSEESSNIESSADEDTTENTSDDEQDSTGTTSDEGKGTTENTSNEDGTTNSDTSADEMASRNSSSTTTDNSSDPNYVVSSTPTMTTVETSEESG